MNIQELEIRLLKQQVEIDNKIIKLQEAMIKDYRDMIDSLIGETKWLDMKKYTLSS